MNQSSQLVLEQQIICHISGNYGKQYSIPLLPSQTVSDIKKQINKQSPHLRYKLYCLMEDNIQLSKFRCITSNSSYYSIILQEQVDQTNNESPQNNSIEENGFSGEWKWKTEPSAIKGDESPPKRYIEVRNQYQQFYQLVEENIRLSNEVQDSVQKINRKAQENQEIIKKLLELEEKINENHIEFESNDERIHEILQLCNEALKEHIELKLENHQNRQYIDLKKEEKSIIQTMCSKINKIIQLFQMYSIESVVIKKQRIKYTEAISKSKQQVENLSIHVETLFPYYYKEFLKRFAIESKEISMKLNKKFSESPPKTYREKKSGEKFEI